MNSKCPWCFDLSNFTKAGISFVAPQWLEIVPTIKQCFFSILPTESQSKIWQTSCEPPTLYLPNSMKLNAFQEANSCSTTQEIPSIL
jgi:hypothetical protein